MDDMSKEYKTEPIPACPMDVVAIMLARPATLLPFPRVKEIIRTPRFSRSGELLASPGYYREAEVLVDLGCFTVPRIAEVPTAADVATARDLLSELVCDFGFETDADRAAWFANILTPCCRGLFSGPSPLFAYEASTPGTGKSLATSLARIVTIGPDARWTDLQLAPRNEKENQQRVLAALAATPTMIMLDNLPQGELVSSAILASVLTSNSHGGRMLGETRHVTFPNAATWMATGNNLRWSTELAARLVPCRLRATCERPRELTGFHHTLPDWAIENRPRLVAAVLTLVRAWIVAGRSPGHAVLGMFQDWASAISGILEHAGIDGLLGNRRELFNRADEEGTIWGPFVQAWADAHGSEPVKVSTLVKLADDNALLGNLIRGDKLRGRAVSLGKQLRVYEDRIFGDWRIGRVRDQPGHYRGCSLSPAREEPEDKGEQLLIRSPSLSGPVAGSGEQGEEGEQLKAFPTRENQGDVDQSTVARAGVKDGKTIPFLPVVPSSRAGGGSGEGNKRASRLQTSKPVPSASPYPASTNERILAETGPDNAVKGSPGPSARAVGAYPWEGRGDTCDT